MKLRKLLGVFVDQEAANDDFQQDFKVSYQSHPVLCRKSRTWQSFTVNDSLAHVTLVSMTSKVTVLSVIKSTNALMALTHVTKTLHVPISISHAKMVNELQKHSHVNITLDSPVVVKRTVPMLMNVLTVQTTSRDCPDHCTCENLVPGFECTCIDGYKKPAKGNNVCKDVDECSGTDDLTHNCHD